MTAKDLFENQHAMRLVKEFENKGIKWQGNMEIMTENLDNDIQRFEGVTGASGDFISEVMEKDSEDLFKYLLYRMRNIMMNGSYSILSNVHKWSIDFTVLKYFPDKLINYFCSREYDKKWLQRHIFEYNEALGTALEMPAKPKAAPKPKTPKSEKRVISTPLHETGLKYSEYDEDYYAMLIEDGKEGNVIVNPRVAAMGQKDGLKVYPPFEPIYKDHKDFRFTDIFREGWCSMFVSERVWMQMKDVIPSENSGALGPKFGKKRYVKNGDDYLPYYGLSLPEYKFIDKEHLKLIEGSKGIICYHDGTDGLEDIVYHSFRPGMMAKMPEAERTIFEIDFHGLGWWFCHKSIKEKFEAAGATGVKFVRSMDMNWWEYNEPSRRALEEYINKKYPRSQE